MHGIKCSIQVALQGLAHWLDHEIGLLLRDVRELAMELCDHGLERARHEWLQASIDWRVGICPTALVVNGAPVRHGNQGMLPSHTLSRSGQTLACSTLHL
jgi:hypothetical protein